MLEIFLAQGAKKSLHYIFNFMSILNYISYIITTYVDIVYRCAYRMKFTSETMEVKKTGGASILHRLKYWGATRLCTFVTYKS